VLISFFLFFFFKQKTAYEIFHVTGVQTCALPIFSRNASSRPTRRQRVSCRSGDGGFGRDDAASAVTIPAIAAISSSVGSGVTLKIGRASCRERGEMSEGAA